MLDSLLNGAHALIDQWGHNEAALDGMRVVLVNLYVPTMGALHDGHAHGAGARLRREPGARDRHRQPCATLLLSRGAPQRCEPEQLRPPTANGWLSFLPARQNAAPCAGKDAGW